MFVGKIDTININFDFGHDPHPKLILEPSQSVSFRLYFGGDVYGYIKIRNMTDSPLNVEIRYPKIPGGRILKVENLEKRVYAGDSYEAFIEDGLLVLKEEKLPEH